MPDSTALLTIPGVSLASSLGAGEAGSSWSFEALAGRLVEVTGTASLTCAARLIHDAQRRVEPAAWVTTERTDVFPPDLAALGVDLTALVVVRVPDGESVPRAGDMLMLSGAFGIVVLDLGETTEVPTPLLSRLCRLAQRHEAVVLCLTEKPAGAASLGSLVSLRGEVRRIDDEAGFRWELLAVKDKRRGPAWTIEERCHGPVGVC